MDRLHAVPSLGAATTGDAADHAHGLRSAVVLVPVGSCEQHGPHLPLDTDTRVAEAVAAGVAAARDDVWVAPTIPYGASGEHQSFAGTASIGHDALRAVLLELGRSLGDQVGRLVFVNGHGGNVATMRAVVDLLVHEGRPAAMWSPRLVDGDAHAGRTETSLLLAIAPDTVRLDRAEAGVTDSLAELLPALRAGGVAAVSPNGVLGDPSGADADEGRRLLAALVEDLAAMIAAPAEPRR